MNLFNTSEESIQNIEKEIGAIEEEKRLIYEKISDTLQLRLPIPEIDFGGDFDIVEGEYENEKKIFALEKIKGGLKKERGLQMDLLEQISSEISEEMELGLRKNLESIILNIKSIDSKIRKKIEDLDAIISSIHSAEGKSLASEYEAEGGPPIEGQAADSLAGIELRINNIYDKIYSESLDNYFPIEKDNSFWARPTYNKYLSLFIATVNLFDKKKDLASGSISSIPNKIKDLERVTDELFYKIYINSLDKEKSSLEDKKTEYSDSNKYYYGGDTYSGIEEIKNKISKKKMSIKIFLANAIKNNLSKYCNLLEKSLYIESYTSKDKYFKDDIKNIKAINIYDFDKNNFDELSEEIKDYASRVLAYLNKIFEALNSILTAESVYSSDLANLESESSSFSNMYFQINKEHLPERLEVVIKDVVGSKIRYDTELGSGSLNSVLQRANESIQSFKNDSSMFPRDAKHTVEKINEAHYNIESLNEVDDYLTQKTFPGILNSGSAGYHPPHEYILNILEYENSELQGEEFIDYSAKAIDYNKEFLDYFRRKLRYISTFYSKKNILYIKNNLEKLFFINYSDKLDRLFELFKENSIGYAKIPISPSCDEYKDYGSYIKIYKNKKIEFESLEKVLRGVCQKIRESLSYEIKALDISKEYILKNYSKEILEEENRSDYRKEKYAKYKLKDHLSEIDALDEGEYGGYFSYERSEKRGIFVKLLEKYKEHRSSKDGTFGSEKFKSSAYYRSSDFTKSLNDSISFALDFNKDLVGNTNEDLFEQEGSSKHYNVKSEININAHRVFQEQIENLNDKNFTSANFLKKSIEDISIRYNKFKLYNSNNEELKRSFEDLGEIESILSSRSFSGANIKFYNSNSKYMFKAYYDITREIWGKTNIKKEVLDYLDEVYRDIDNEKYINFILNLIVKSNENSSNPQSFLSAISVVSSCLKIGVGDSIVLLEEALKRDIDESSAYSEMENVLGDKENYDAIANCFSHSNLNLKNIDKAYILLKYFEKKHSSAFQRAKGLDCKRIIPIINLRNSSGVFKTEAKRNIIDTAIEISFLDMKRYTTDYVSEKIESLSDAGIDLGDKFHETISLVNRVKRFSDDIYGKSNKNLEYSKKIKLNIAEIKLFNSVMDMSSSHLNYIKKFVPNKKSEEIYSLNMDLVDGQIRFRVLDNSDNYIIRAGIDTDCCQYIGGLAESVVYDAIGNDKASILLLEFKPKNNYKYRTRSGNEKPRKTADGYHIISQSYFHYVDSKTKVYSNGKDSLYEKYFILDNIESAFSSVDFLEDHYGFSYENAYERLSSKLKSDGFGPLVIGKKYTNFLNENRVLNGSMDSDPRYFHYTEKFLETSFGSRKKVYTDFDKKEFFIINSSEMNKIARAKKINIFYKKFKANHDLFFTRNRKSHV